MFMRMDTHRTELETCDNCGRDFRTTADAPEQDEVLCPRCTDAAGDGPATPGSVPATEQQFEDYLADLLENDDEHEPQVDTFHAAGVLTTNRGLVVRLRNGAEFQVTIVRSR